MNLLPYETETFVVALEWDALLNALNRTTTKKIRFQNQEDDNDKSFVGWIQSDRFRISIKISRPNSFIPLVIGQIEPTSTGCIVFVQYCLFPATRMYLTFWTLFILLAGIIFFFQYKSYLILLIAVSSIGIIHWIAWANFTMQLKRTRESLMKVLS